MARKTRQTRSRFIRISSQDTRAPFRDAPMQIDECWPRSFKTFSKLRCHWMPSTILTISGPLVGNKNWEKGSTRSIRSIGFPEFVPTKPRHTAALRKANLYRSRINKKSTEYDQNLNLLPGSSRTHVGSITVMPSSQRCSHLQVGQAADDTSPPRTNALHDLRLCSCSTRSPPTFRLRSIAPRKNKT